MQEMTDQNALSDENANSPAGLSMDDIRDMTESDMRLVNGVIRKRLHSDVALINQLSVYIINSGGKRIRPMLLILCARACNYPNNVHVDLAAIVEFIHTATLLHDDVVDASELRRGRESANAIWGNEASVLVGDFLYSRAFEMMVDVGSMRVMEILARATNVIAEGEVMQLLNCNDPDTTEERYLEVIRYKTAKLFEAAGQLGAVISNATSEQEQALAKYGMHLGTAFQIIDDVLDYSGNANDIGKNIGDDLAEGKPTLPLIYAMRHGNQDQREIIRNAIKKGGLEHIDSIKETIACTGAIDYTEKVAQHEAELAVEQLECIPPSKYRDALYRLAEFSIARDH